MIVTILNIGDSTGVATFVIATISFFFSLVFLLSAYFRIYFQKSEKNKYILAGILVLLFVLSCLVSMESYTAIIILLAYVLGRFVPMKVNLLKIGLILLLVSGISLLLTSVLCGWY